MPDRDRLAKCLALAARGATEGERAAALAAAERIAASAGLTLAEARRQGLPDAVSRARTWATAPRGQPPRAHSATVADALRERAERDAKRRRRARAAERRPDPSAAERGAWEAEVRASQAERDRAWAERGQPPSTSSD